jgi:methylenetetrahydrofolate--tRNA-(uracil-5-)-methyltransferase
MNINFGLFPPVAVPERDGNGRRLKGSERGQAKKRAIAERALADLSGWLSGGPRAVVAA